MNTLTAIRDTLLSCAAFFLRWPTVHVVSFKNEGLIFGGILQALIWILFYFLFSRCFQNLPQGLAFFLSLVSLSLVTGFFHEDGFADTADSLGVPIFKNQSISEQREKVVAAMRDSRLGSYGVCALILLWIFRYFGSTQAHLNGTLGFFLILSSRSNMLAFGTICQKFYPLQRCPKSSHNLYGIPFQFSILPAALVVLAALYNPTFVYPTVFVWLFGFLLIKRTGHLFGDFLGALACAFEVLFFIFLFLKF